MTRLNTVLYLVFFAVGILSSPVARGAYVDGQSASFVWEPATGPVVGYGVWISWAGVAAGDDPDQLVNEASATVEGSYGQTFSIQVAGFDQGGNWGPPSPASEDVFLAPPPPPPVAVLTFEGNLTLSDPLVELAGSGVQLTVQMTGQARQLLDVSPLDSVMTEDGRFGLDQLVVGAPDEASRVRLIEATNLDLAQGVDEVYLFGLGNGEPCARDGEAGLRIHEGSTLILGGLDLYAFDGAECVYINSLFPGSGDAPNTIAYDEGTILLYGDLDEDEMWDPDDNCLIVENADQRDADADGYGTACDADYNNDGWADYADFEIFKASYGTRESDERYLLALDHDSNGVITFTDFLAFLPLAGAAPGPSGLACAGVVPCD
jgi:hypothetical protein